MIHKAATSPTNVHKLHTRESYIDLDLKIVTSVPKNPRIHMLDEISVGGTWGPCLAGKWALVSVYVGLGSIGTPKS